MIPLNLFDYTEHCKIDLEITKYVNNCIATIVEVILDMRRDDPDFGLEGFLPRDYITRNPEECRNLLDELYEMLTSNVLRDWIKPKYEFLLFNILNWWEDCCEDVNDLIPCPLENKLLQEIKNEPRFWADDDVNTILQELMDFNSYSDFCFLDHDFLPDELSKMVTIFLRNSDLFNRFFPDVNLDDYVDLMPCDLREFYLEKKLIPMQDVIQDIEKGILNEISKILQRFQKRVLEFENRSEVEISNDICDAIAGILKTIYNLQVSREATMGRAIVALGETDLYIYKEDQNSIVDYAIVENKFIENFLQQYRQLLGYLNHYFKFGVTISINKKYSLMDAIQKIVHELNNIDDKDFPITSIDRDIEGLPYVVRSCHTIPEDKTRQMPIYHMIFQLYDVERKCIAKKARRK